MDFTTDRINRYKISYTPYTASYREQYISKEEKLEQINGDFIPFNM